MKAEPKQSRTRRRQVCPAIGCALSAISITAATAGLASRVSMDIGTSSDRGGLAYWVHVWRPALTGNLNEPIRAEEAEAASALRRMPARCPAVGGSLWI